MRLASRLHSELFWFGYDKSASRLEKAKAAADAALKLQPDLGEAHLANAFYYYYGFRQYDVAQKHVTAAIRAIPNDADVLNTAGAIARREAEDGMKRLKNVWSRRAIATQEIFQCCGSSFESYLALHEYAKAERTVSDALSVSSTATFLFWPAADSPYFAMAILLRFVPPCGKSRAVLILAEQQARSRSAESDGT